MLTNTFVNSREETILKDVTQEELLKYQAHVDAITDETERLALAKETAEYSKTFKKASKDVKFYRYITLTNAFVLIPFFLTLTILVATNTVNFISQQNLFVVVFVWAFINRFVFKKLDKAKDERGSVITKRPSFLD